VTAWFHVEHDMRDLYMPLYPVLMWATQERAEAEKKAAERQHWARMFDIDADLVERSVQERGHDGTRALILSGELNRFRSIAAIPELREVFGLEPSRYTGTAALSVLGILDRA
jgi:hypothetical protein